MNKILITFYISYVLPYLKNVKKTLYHKSLIRHCRLFTNRNFCNLHNGLFNYFVYAVNFTVVYNKGR